MHCASGVKKLHDGFEVDIGMAGIVISDLLLAVGDELFGLGLGEECHVEVPSVGGPKRSFHQTEGPRRSAQESSDTRYAQDSQIPNQTKQRT